MNRAIRKRLQRLVEKGRAGLARPLPPNADLAARATRVDLEQFYRTVEALNEGSPGPELARQLVRELHTFTQAAEDSLPPEPRIACQMGCSWCCYVALQVTPMDAVGVADHLGGEAESWRPRLHHYTEQLWERVGRQAAALKRDFAPCPFLEDDRCQVYASRPVLCRAFHSMDAGVCRAVVTERRVDRSVPLDLARFGFAGLPQEGMLRALDEAGIDRRTVVLGPAVGYLLGDFEGIVTAWLEGQSVWDSVAVKR